MARTVPNAFLLARALLADSDAWLTFVEVELLEGQFARVVDDGAHHVAGGHTWQASKAIVEGLEESVEGAPGDVRITLPNVSGLPLVWIDALDGVLGRRVTLRLAHESDLPNLSDALRWDYVCTRADITMREATLRAGHPASLAQAPSVVFSRDVFPQINAGGPPR